MVNKELNSKAYTYDFKGNVVMQAKVNVEALPKQFRFKYHFRKG